MNTFHVCGGMILQCPPKSRRQGPERCVPRDGVVVVFNRSTQVILLGVYEKENNMEKKVKESCQLA